LQRCYLDEGQTVTDKDNRKLLSISPHANNYISCFVRMPHFIVKLQVSSSEGSTPSPPCLHYVLQGGRSWLLWACAPLGQVKTSLYGPSGVIVSNFKYIACQEVLLLLQVSIVSSKEAKRTSLTPVDVLKGAWKWDKPLWTLWSHHLKFQVSSLSGSIPSRPCIHCVL
jgi:hypothetical protein